MLAFWPTRHGGPAAGANLFVFWVSPIDQIHITDVSKFEFFRFSVEGEFILQEGEVVKCCYSRKQFNTILYFWFFSAISVSGQCGSARRGHPIGHLTP